MEAIVVGVALVVLDDLAVAEVGVEAALGHGTADVDAVMFVFVMGAVDGGVDSGQVLGWVSCQCSDHESGHGENGGELHLERVNELIEVLMQGRK